jgi:hypothetical protein
MSYSRWSNSVWYTYWSAYSPDCNFKLPTRKLKYGQVFTICGIPGYDVTYGDLVFKRVGGVLDEIKTFFSKPYQTNKMVDYVDGVAVYEDTEIPGKTYTEEEMMELMKYLYAFIDDVDESFTAKTFFYENWYIPLRNKIGRLFKK